MFLYTQFKKKKSNSRMQVNLVTAIQLKVYLSKANKKKVVIFILFLFFVINHHMRQGYFICKYDIDIFQTRKAGSGGI